jgi:hypothetical protein
VGARIRRIGVLVGMKVPRVGAARRRAREIAPSVPSMGSVSTIVAPNAVSAPRRSSFAFAGRQISTG